MGLTLLVHSWRAFFFFNFFSLQSSWSSTHLHLSTQNFFFVVKSIVWMGLEVVKQVLGGSWDLASIFDSYLLWTWAHHFHFPPVSFSSCICLNYWNCQLLAPRACCLCQVEQDLILTHGPADHWGKCCCCRQGQERKYRTVSNHIENSWHSGSSSPDTARWFLSFFFSVNSFKNILLSKHLPMLSCLSLETGSGFNL